MSLLSALEEIGIHPKQTSHGVYQSPCPWCQGDDRFHIFTEQDQDVYWCRKCDKKGDEIRFYKEYHHLSFPDAARKAGQEKKIKDTRQTNRDIRANQKRTFSSSQEDAMTDNEWFSTSQLWRKIMEERLILPSMEYLKHHEHGILKRKRIESDTSTSLKIGYNPKYFHIDPSELGVTETEPPPKSKTYESCKWYLLNGLKTSIKEKGIWIPQGIVIPYYRDGILQSVKVRLGKPLPDTEIRYAAIKGSREICFALYASQFGKEDPGLPWMIVESELDAVLIYQEAHDLVNVAALRSISNMPDKTTMEAIGNREIIFVPDNEIENGSFKNQKQVNKWYETFGSKMHLWLTSDGSKDPSDMAAKFKKNPIRSWVENAIHILLNKIDADSEQTKTRPQADDSDPAALTSSCGYHSEIDSRDEDATATISSPSCGYISGSDPEKSTAVEDSQCSNGYDSSNHQKTSRMPYNRSEAPREYQHTSQSHRSESEPNQRKIIDPYQQAVWNKKAEEYQEHLQIWNAYQPGERVSRADFISGFILPVVGKPSLANRAYEIMESFEYIKEIDGIIYPDMDPALFRRNYE